MAAASRLRTALADGLLTIPAGPVSIARPPVGYDLAELPADQLLIQQTFHPDFAQWSGAGLDVSTAFRAAPTSIIVVPRSKAQAQDMVARAASSSDLIILDGTKTDGIESLYKAARKRLGDLPCVAKDHGRIFWFTRTEAFADWALPPPGPGPHGFTTTAGVFSDGAIDKGSALLAAALPAKLPKRMADLGAGWGYLSDAVLSHDSVTSLDLIEAEALALDCARINITDPRARFHWADATQFRPETAYDGIVMNPPFHVGRAGDPGLGRAFITAAARMLTPSGQMWLVANRHLPYEAALRDAFRQVTELPGSGGFKIFHAIRPQR